MRTTLDLSRAIETEGAEDEESPRLMSDPNVIDGLMAVGLRATALGIIEAAWRHQKLVEATTPCFSDRYDAAETVDDDKTWRLLLDELGTRDVIVLAELNTEAAAALTRSRPAA